MMEKCSFCGNTHLKSVMAEYTWRHDGHCMIFHNVPAMQCEYCGEKYFDAQTLKRIEKESLSILQCDKKPSEEIRVPVEDFARLNVA